MKYLLTGVAAIAMLTACGDKDKPVDAAGSEYASDAANDISLRKGDPATAPQALAALALDKPDSSRITFASSDLKGDRAVFTDVVLLASDDEDDDEDNHLSGTDVKAGQLVFDGLAMVDGKARFSKMTLSDISMVPTDPEEAAEGSATIGSIDLINPSPELAAWVAAAFAEGDPGDLPSGNALSFDQWSMTDMNMQIDEDEGDKGTFAVETLSVTGMKNQKAGQMLLNGLTFDMFDSEDDMTVKANLSNVDIRGLDFSVFAPEDGEDLGDSFESGFMAGLNPKDPANPGYNSVVLKDLSLDVSGVNFDMPSLDSTVTHDDQGRAVKVVTKPVKMTLNAGSGELGEQLGAQLATLGYEKLELTMASEQVYDPEADIVTVEKGKNYWELKDGFRLDFGAKYEGASAMAAAQADQDIESADPSAMLNDVMGMLSIHSLDLSLDDDGIVARAFNAYAAQSGEDPQQLRNQTAGLMAMAPMMLGGSGIDADLLTEASTALSSFITDPKTLTLSLNPETPLKVSTLANMEDPSALTKSSLGFSASNE